MIIDVILDRYNGSSYNPKDIYYYTLIFGFDKLGQAMDYGTEEDVKRELCRYIDNEYNPRIKDFIKACRWLDSDTPHDYSHIKIID